ncbi:UNVERIFIED_CONTAM: hypothetical protein O8I53_11710 [Campylobacter lari]
MNPALSIQASVYLANISLRSSGFFLLNVCLSGYLEGTCLDQSGVLSNLKYSSIYFLLFLIHQCIKLDAAAAQHKLKSAYSYSICAILFASNQPYSVLNGKEILHFSTHFSGSSL